MTTKGLVNICMSLALFLAPTLAMDASAAERSWSYADIRYQQPEDKDVNGFVAEVSGHISRRWLLQGRANPVFLDDGNIEVTQTRYDLSVGRLFRLGHSIDAVVSGGYTHVEYEAKIPGLFTIDDSDDFANVQLALRGSFGKRFEAEASLGMLADEKETSDLLWSTALRYRVTHNWSMQLGVHGTDESTSASDLLYELGFRFDLPE